MKLKEVIKSACESIGLDDVLSHIDDLEISSAIQSKIDGLIAHFNRVQEEIASEFIDVVANESIVADGEISFSNLDNQILDVIYIRNNDGKKVNFICYPDKVTFDGTSKEILYTFVPDELDQITDDIVFLVPKRVYGYGIAREYFIKEGLSDKAQIFEEKFKNSINLLLQKDKKIALTFAKSIPERKWM